MKKKERENGKEGFGYFVLWHSNLRVLFNIKAIVAEVQLWNYLTHRWGR